MKNLISASLALLLAAAPVAAQRSGSLNADAPTVTQSIKFKDDSSIKVEYFAPAWGTGKTVDTLMDKEKGARARAGMNKNAEGAPIGSFNTSKDLTIGDQAVAAGDYKLMFTFDDNAVCHLVLVSGEKKIDFPLTLTDTGKDHKRLCIGFEIGEKPSTSELTIAFGKKGCALKVASGGAAKKGDDASHGKEHGKDEKKAAAK